MDILSVATQEVQEIFSQVVDDASVSVETLEGSVVRACRELGRKVQRWASGESVSAYVDEQSLAPGARWYVSCDGCHTASVDGWQEVKVGCLYGDEPHCSPGSMPSTRSSSLRYVASRTDAVSFGSQWFDLATASGIYQDKTDTEEVVVIGDGTPWIWNLSAEYFPGVLR